MSQVPDLASALNISLNRGDGTTGPRIPMLFTCSMWTVQNLPPLALKINPHNVTFKQGKRITKRNSAGGTTYMHWTDDNGQNNDVLELAFRGRTGNISLRRNAQARKSAIGQAAQDFANWLSGETSSQEMDKNQGGAKLMSWARLYELTRMPMVDPATRRENSFFIVYRSPLFPKPVLFQGFFNNVLDFSEVAENQSMVEWSFSFVVQSTMPSLDYLSTMLSFALAGNPAGSQVAKEAIDTTQFIENASASATSADFKNG